MIGERETFPARSREARAPRFPAEALRALGVRIGASEPDTPAARSGLLLGTRASGPHWQKKRAGEDARAPRGKGLSPSNTRTRSARLINCFLAHRDSEEEANGVPPRKSGSSTHWPVGAKSVRSHGRAGCGRRLAQGVNSKGIIEIPLVSRLRGPAVVLPSILFFVRSLTAPLPRVAAAVLRSGEMVTQRVAPVHCGIAGVHRWIAPLHWAAAVVHWRIAPLQNPGAVLHYAVVAVHRRIAVPQSRNALLQNASAPLHSGIAPLQRRIAPVH